MYFKLEQIVYDGRRCARIGFGKFRRDQWDTWIEELKRSRAQDEQDKIKSSSDRGIIHDIEKELRGG